MSYSKNYICRFTQANLWHHKLLHFHLPFWVWKMWKGRERITKNWICQERKELFWWKSSRNSKLAPLDGKLLTSFTWNLLQNLKSLILNSENNRKWTKIAKTEIVGENAYMRLRRLSVNLCRYFAAYKLYLKKQKEIEFSVRIQLFISPVWHKGWGSLL